MLFFVVRQPYISFLIMNDLWAAEIRIVSSLSLSVQVCSISLSLSFSLLSSLSLIRCVLSLFLSLSLSSLFLSVIRCVLSLFLSPLSPLSLSLYYFCGKCQYIGWVSLMGQGSEAGGRYFDGIRKRSGGAIFRYLSFINH